MALTAPFSAVASRASSAARSAGQVVMIYALIGLLGLLGAGFLVAALYIWIASVTDPLIAALLMGTGLLAISGITLAVVIASGKKEKQERRRSAANAAVMASTLSLASTGLRMASRAQGKFVWPALAAIAAGLYFTRGSRD